MRIQILTLAGLALVGSVAGKSLWDSKKNNESGMFADRKATHVGDIITVNVAEETVVNRTSSKASSNGSTINHSFGTVVLPGLLGEDTTLPSITGVNPTETFNGTGSVSDTNLFESKIAVMVVDVQPNGNLIIEGARKIKASGEGQYLVVRGIVRGDDVLSNNTVDSVNILNASVELFSEGDLKNAQTKGWVQRLVDMTNIL